MSFFIIHLATKWKIIFFLSFFFYIIILSVLEGNFPLMWMWFLLLCLFLCFLLLWFLLLCLLLLFTFDQGQEGENVQNAKNVKNVKKMGSPRLSDPGKRLETR
eukprot:Rmarinus@m.16673